MRTGLDDTAAGAGAFPWTRGALVSLWPTAFALVAGALGARWDALMTRLAGAPPGQGGVAER